MPGLFLRLTIAFLCTLLSLTSFAQSGAEEARVYLLRGQTAIEMAKSDADLVSAAEEFKKATEAAPKMARAWHSLGAVQAKLGQYKEAIDSYNRYLALAPRSSQTVKIKDEVIKLRYRLERDEKFKSLSGQWISTNTLLANITADGNKLVIKMNALTIPDSSEVWMYDKRVPGAAGTFNNPTITLERTGNKLTGTLEIPGEKLASSESGWCYYPGEKSPVEGTLEKGQIHLKLVKIKFKMEMNKNDTLFSSPKLHCDEVSPMGTMPVEIDLMGPLEKGGINSSAFEMTDGNLLIRTSKDSAPGLEDGDVIISVDGHELAQLKNFAEKLMKLRGKPGSTVQLGIIRAEKPKADGSDSKKMNLNIAVKRVEMH